MTGKNVIFMSLGEITNQKVKTVLNFKDTKLDLENIIFYPH